MEFASRAQILNSCPITAETSKWQSRSIQGPGQAGLTGNLGILPEPDGGVANGDGQGSGGSWEGRLPATRVPRLGLSDPNMENTGVLGASFALAVFQAWLRGREGETASQLRLFQRIGGLNVGRPPGLFCVSILGG